MQEKGTGAEMRSAMKLLKLYTAKQSVFFSKSVKKLAKRGVRVLRAFSASFQTFCLTARAYLNAQKYGLFCSQLKLGFHFIF